MKKTLIILTALFHIQLNAQNAIPNPGFENWTNLGSYDNPDGWGTLNGLTSIIGIRTVTKATAASEVHSGNTAIKLKTIPVPGQGVAPGIAATGTINPTTRGIDGGIPFNLRPANFTGWFKFLKQGSDTCLIGATLSKWNSSSNSRVVVGQAQFRSTNSVNSYERFAVNFTYSSADIPDTLMLTMLSSESDNGTDGTTLWVDDLAFDSQVGIEDNDPLPVGVYPNPAQRQITVKLKESQSGKIYLYNLSGTLVLQHEILDGSAYVNIENLSAGFYFYRLFSDAEDRVQQGRLIKH